jgi:Sodium/calcium exchanger protein.
VQPSVERSGRGCFRALLALPAQLGPSTIVGSAAFNMLVISAVCVTAIPDGGGRLIKELPVFYVTAAFSLLAYVWLIFILVLSRHPTARRCRHASCPPRMPPLTARVRPRLTAPILSTFGRA